MGWMGVDLLKKLKCLKLENERHRRAVRIWRCWSFFLPSLMD